MIDSNVLLDVMSEDQSWFDWSSEQLARAADTSRLVINPVIYAEVSVRFTKVEDVEDALPRSSFDREPIPYEAAFLAGKAFVAYRRRGGLRGSTLPDFLVGAHAAVAGYQLITRDPHRFRTYFPALELIAPG